MSNSIAVVTGAGSGIGAAIAKELAKRGNFVVVTDLNLASAKKVADEIGNADAIELDVTNPAVKILPPVIFPVALEIPPDNKLVAAILP